ncbi:hypothetical protein GSI_05312 [Ganoderma sinense ZZ0214-1]|uniref:Transporter n=1 Tax=Ganoderma sinense ZZ0214-1 TaxID=1077348 RepID=A0A2G8SFR1_9APHY|nr:hypothetical protein GSI_05312 [Ganoderma sinense ZZ0214-1]
MHLVTSVIFLPSCAAHFSPGSLCLLVRAYFATSLAVYISRGRPALPLAAFYAGTTARPKTPKSHAVHVAEGTLDGDVPIPEPLAAHRRVDSAAPRRPSRETALRAPVHCRALPDHVPPAPSSS